MDLVFRGPAGSLAGLLEEPEGEPRAAAIVCHPHPLYGGTLRNTIVFRVARALRASGLVTLRFDFRGAGGSQGTHDGQGGEEADAAAALDLLADRRPGLPLWAAGYSFGARTVCALAERERRIERLILVALPIARYDCPAIERLEQPGLVVFGGGDPLGSAAELARRHPRLPAGLVVQEIPGADHFFKGRTPVLEQRVREYASRSTGAAP